MKLECESGAKEHTPTLRETMSRRSNIGPESYLSFQDEVQLICQRRLDYYELLQIYDNGGSFTYYLLTESEVITGKSQTEALMY